MEPEFEGPTCSSRFYGVIAFYDLRRGVAAIELLCSLIYMYTYKKPSNGRVEKAALNSVAMVANWVLDRRG